MPAARSPSTCHSPHRRRKRRTRNRGRSGGPGRVKGLPSPRPLTHDLVASVIEHLGGELQDIFISDLRDHTYFAKLRIRQDGEMIEVDSRPSDAIALAVTAKVPIYVAEDVLGEVCGEQ